MDYVRTILSEPKFLGCIDNNQIFLPMVLRWGHKILSDNQLGFRKHHSNEYAVTPLYLIRYLFLLIIMN